MVFIGVSDKGSCHAAVIRVEIFQRVGYTEKGTLLVLLGGFAVLRRPAKEMAVTAAAGVVLAMLLRVILPFGL